MFAHPHFDIHIPRSSENLLSHFAGKAEIFEEHLCIPFMIPYRHHESTLVVFISRFQLPLFELIASWTKQRNSLC